MGWREDLRPASFRGVPFFVETANSAHGRNTIIHEFPGKADPFVEDLGRQPRSFRIDAFLVGPNYHLDRDRLIDAIETPGAGLLIHPYRGELRVNPGPMEVRETTQEGGLCRVAVVFVQVGSFPTGLTSVAAARPSAERAAIAVDDAAQAELVPDLQVLNQPSFVAEAAAASWDAALQEMLQLRLAEFEEWRAEVTRASQDVLERLTAPVTFARDCSRLILSIASHAAGQLEAVRAYLQMASILPYTVRGQSDQAAIARAGARSITEMVQAMAIAGAARSAADATYESYDEALEVRGQVLDGLDAIEDDAGDDVLQELSELRRSLVASVPPPDANLPRLDHFIPPSTLPALVIAYTLYDDVAREAEIVARNHIPHPGFCPEGGALEVLVDAA